MTKFLVGTEQNVSCHDLRAKYPSLTTGVYDINPTKGKSANFQVFCDMTSKDSIGVTVIGHDSESRTKVDGYGAPGSYLRNIKYDNTMEQIVAVIDKSAYCEQFIKYECDDSRLLKDGTSWWVSRQGNRMNYWGGAAVDSGKCACGMTNSCAYGFSCNCDGESSDWHEDSGFLTDKSTLPVTQLRIGDTGDSAGYGYYTLGKLYCW